MADWNYDDFDGPADEGDGPSLVNWAGAALSLLLIAGLATWGWKLMLRDVTGVPVVRALEGPMRVAPADPGGDAAAYQGLAVNRVAEEMSADTRVDEVRLAPQPDRLADEDVAMAAMLPEPAETDNSKIFADPGVETVEVAPMPLFGSQMEEAEAVRPAKEPSATDLAVAAALAGIGGLEPTPASLVVDDLGGRGPTLSPRPAVRPAERRVASLAPVADSATGDIDPATIAPGTRLVQLGAYGSAETARIEWANALSLFGDYMVGKDRVIQEAQTGGKTFYRLRAMGFSDLDDARRFCAVLVAEGANCIPVVQQ